ncbi:hypothetical protein F5Y16DRAFT_204654 [Xylariaceae sp. FL0255]|nr:hypothetical protein F5Y16DRAFT_204654 [Xylariaceae sp. FL0255]
MNPRSPEESSLDLDQSLMAEIPEPLRIIKQTKAMEFNPFIGGNPRKGSMGSMDEGPDEPLRVTRKRPLTKTAKRDQSSSTVHRYDLRSHEIASVGSEADSTSNYCLDTSESYEPTFESSPFSTTQTSLNLTSEPAFLIPQISVKTEVRGGPKCPPMVWAVVEVSIESLSRPGQTWSPHTDYASHYEQLYNVHIDILPTPQSSILECFRSPDENTDYILGSKHLVLAKMQLTDKRLWHSDGYNLYQSARSIAGYDHQHDTGLVEYLQICVRYQHPSFPNPAYSVPVNGTLGCQTTLQTSVTGVVEARTLMSPRDPYINARQSSLFKTVMSYWGHSRASEVLRCSRPSDSRNELRTTPLATHTGNHPNLQPLTRPATSNTNRESRTPKFYSQNSRSPPRSQQNRDPAHELWGEMRRRSFSRRVTKRASNVDQHSAANLSALSCMTSITGEDRNTDVARRREIIRDVALRNKRSIGADSLKSLVPSLDTLDIGDSKDEDKTETYLPGFKKENFPPKRNRTARWSLGTWF